MRHVLPHLTVSPAHCFSICLSLSLSLSLSVSLSVRLSVCVFLWSRDGGYWFAASVLRKRLATVTQLQLLAGARVVCDRRDPRTITAARCSDVFQPARIAALPTQLSCQITYRKRRVISGLALFKLLPTPTKSRFHRRYLVCLLAAELRTAKPIFTKFRGKVA